MIYRNGKCDAVGMLVFLELDYFEATQVFLKLLYIEATLLFPIQRNATSRRKIHAA